MSLPEKRGEVLFCRVTEANKAFVAAMAEAQGVSESVYVDFLITKVRTANDRQQAKPRRSAG